MKEIYKKYPHNEDYEVSNHGIVNGIRRKKIGSTRVEGYRTANVKDVGIRYIHRMVWETFEGSIPSYLEINHKDGDRANNRLDNLELMTHKQNINHSFEVLGREVISGARHHLHGKAVSKDTKAKMSAKKRGALHPKFKGWYVVDDIEYETPADAVGDKGRNPKTIARWCKKGTNNCYFKPKK